MLGFIKKYWRRILLGSFALALVMFMGAFLAMYQRTQVSEQLQAALNLIETGGVKDETPEFKNRADLLLDEPTATLVAGGYTNVAVYNGVKYNAAIVFKLDGTFETALTVGSASVYKTYSQGGKWFVRGRVLHTIQTSGDRFLTPPAARDGSTPARELIISSSPTQITLQASHSREPVRFERVMDQPDGVVKPATALTESAATE